MPTMPWTSYAQNREDVLLRRAFAGVSSGFYIDVGACDPVLLSVTKTFYDAGWSGINIEASPKQHALVAAARPRDLNLCVGCSDHPGTMTFFKARGDAVGLSTFAADEVQAHKARGFAFDEITVPLTTLADICREHVGSRTIDFVKIDVEGHEAAVIAGADFVRFRPRVLLVEATRPLSQEVTHAEWEQRLLDADYLFATFDGLNRYYVRKEDAHLREALSVMPNVFDDYIPYEYQRQIEALEAELAAYRRSQLALTTAVRAARSVWSATRAAGDWLRRSAHRP